MKDSEKSIMEADYLDGLQHEKNVIEKLRSKGYIVEPTERYDPFDFKINDNYLIELKSRNCFKDKYQTTLLGYNKIQEYRRVKKSYKDLVLIFKFTDGEFYTTYRKICKATPRCKIRPFTRYSGYQHQTKPYVHIPVNLLKPLKQLVLG